jgi:hypothetical protein
MPLALRYPTQVQKFLVRTTAAELLNLQYRSPPHRIYSALHRLCDNCQFQRTSVTFQYADQPLVSGIMEFHKTNLRSNDCTHIYPCGAPTNLYSKSMWIGQEAHLFGGPRDMSEKRVFSLADLAAVHFASVRVSGGSSACPCRLLTTCLDM